MFSAITIVSFRPISGQTVDLHIPRLSGFDVQSRVRAKHIESPVVFITASDDIALDRAVVEAGEVKLLRKPFSNDELLVAVDGAPLRKQRDPSRK